MDLMQTSQLLGNFGEFVGAIAVVATLLYLATQVRQGKLATQANTKAIHAQAMSDVTRNIQAEMHIYTQTPELSEAMFKMSRDEPLSEKEMFLVDLCLTASFISRQTEFFQFEEGLLHESVFKSLHHPIILLLSSKSGQFWWSHEGFRMLAPEFVKFVEELRSQNDPREWVSSIEREA